jgi:hypothetical protein
MDPSTVDALCAVRHRAAAALRGATAGPPSFLLRCLPQKQKTPAFRKQWTLSVCCMFQEASLLLTLYRSCELSPGHALGPSARVAGRLPRHRLRDLAVLQAARHRGGHRSPLHATMTWPGRSKAMWSVRRLPQHSHRGRAPSFSLLLQASSMASWTLLSPSFIAAPPSAILKPDGRDIFGTVHGNFRCAVCACAISSTYNQAI